MGFHATTPLLIDETPSKNRVMGSRRFSFDDAGKIVPQVAESHQETTLTVTIYVSGLHCGEQFDHDIGLYFLRARYMDADRGRFWSMDTVNGVSTDPRTLHKYLYAANSPVTYVDPSGHEFTISWQMVLQGIQAIVRTIGAYYSVAAISTRVANLWLQQAYIATLVLRYGTGMKVALAHLSDSQMGKANGISQTAEAAIRRIDELMRSQAVQIALKLPKRSIKAAVLGPVGIAYNFIVSGDELAGIVGEKISILNYVLETTTGCSISLDTADWKKTGLFGIAFLTGQFYPEYVIGEAELMLTATQNGNHAEANRAQQSIRSYLSRFFDVNC